MFAGRHTRPPWVHSVKCSFFFFHFFSVIHVSTSSPSFMKSIFSLFFFFPDCLRLLPLSFLPSHYPSLSFLLMYCLVEGRETCCISYYTGPWFEFELLRVLFLLWRLSTLESELPSIHLTGPPTPLVEKPVRRKPARKSQSPHGLETSQG